MMCRMLPGCLVLLCLTGWAHAQEGPVELLGEPGFERADNGLPATWAVDNAGKLSSVTEARSGELAARFVAVPHDWGYCAMSAPIPRVAPGGVYHLRLWAKGSGTITFAVYQYSAAGFIGTTFLEPALTLTDQWQKLEATYTAKDRRIRKAAFAIGLRGNGAVATFDDASFTFDPKENPGLSVAPEMPKTLTLRLAVQARDARPTLTVNGHPAPIATGVATAVIPEGLACLALQAEAIGAQPGLNVRLLDCPESDGRWRVSATPAEGWQKPEFDDTRWAVATPAADGYLWWEGQKTVALRQVILWNATHTGPNRCLIPPVKVWEFPRGGFDTLHLALYSPLPVPLTDYQFILDMPEQFTLLDKQDYQPRYLYNNRPEKIVVEPIMRDGMKYRRYRFSHRPAEVTAEQTQWSLLPVTLDTGARFESCRFYFRRQARGNFTELEQTLPVKILPPIRGRMPKQILISQYSPIGYSTKSAAHLRELVRQDVAAGCNLYMMGWNHGWGEPWRQYMKLFHDTTTTAGAKLVLWMNYPLNYGGLDEGHLVTYPEWIKSHPEAQGRYYNDTPKWDPAKRTAPFCNQYAISPEATEFWRIVKQEYARALEFLPRAEFCFTDWEFHNLNKDGTGVHCFCDRCKQAFATFAKLPAGTDLSDAAIVKNHREQWVAFRDWQDGQLQGRIRDVCHELGRQYVTYSWAHNFGYWSACRGQIDAAFVGCPGNSPADSYFQKGLDAYAAEFRDKTGLRRALGQRFVFFKGHGPKDWQVMVLADDGFVHPKSWKSQVLRVVASLQGGIDLQNSDELCGGIRYYLGEATRLIAEYEPLFWEGERADDLATSKELAYPNLLVLRRGDERLVLLFNETQKPLTVRLENRNLRPGQTATVWESKQTVTNAARMVVTVPAEDVAAVHVSGGR